MLLLLRRARLVSPPARLLLQSLRVRSISEAEVAGLRGERVLLDRLLEEKDARIAAAERELRERVAELRERVSSVERDKDALLASVRDSAAREIALSKHDADVAKGVVDARGLFEACVADMSRGLADDGGTVSSRLQRILKLPEVVAYLKAAAADNSIPEDTLLRQARKLYDVVSERVHAEAASRGSAVRLPAALFERSGRPTLVAFAAFVRFSGRVLSMYTADGCDVHITLRTPIACKPLGGLSR